MRDELLAMFRELVDLSTDARARYFEEHQVRPQLRAEIESLLAYDAPTPWLAGPVEREAKDILQSGAAAGSGAFGPYRTIGVLGEGGMGIVYLAEQTEPVRRRVALKVIKHAPSGSLIARFESERQALALLDHPNIAKLYDAGETSDGRPWFAMEYVPGLPITDYCDTNQLALLDRVLLFQHVCRAVEHAHDKGIIHRDLKPSNILVAKASGVATPKVIDFGVAKALNLRLTERTLFTETGMLIGTPEYMSPEQTGESEIDATTDIYSLGVVLYELLVGATPFDSKSLRRAGYNEICRIIRDTDPPRPITRLNSLGDTAGEVARRRGGTVASLARTVQGDLEWITMKALEKEPARRYASPVEFAADLERHLHHQPVKARAPSVRYRLGKFARRRRLELTSVAALLLAVIAGALALSRNGPPPGPENMTQHRIELPGASFDTSYTDGARVVYKDPAIGEPGKLISYDSSRKTTHVIYDDKLGDLWEWVPSKDFSEVALLFPGRPGRPGRLAVTRTDGSGYRELWRGDSEGSGFDEGCDLGYWSWDNRWFLYHQAIKSSHRLFLVSALTGEHRELTSWTGQKWFEGGAFSQDGRFVAWQVHDAKQGRQILLAPTTGGAPRVVYEEGGVGFTFSFLDWTADARYLIIASGGTGRRALHLVPLRDGQPAGEPVFLRHAAVGVSGRGYGYTLKSGALMYRSVKPGSLHTLYIASLDPAGRPGSWRKLDANLQNENSPEPNWSPDSSQIVYVSRDTEVGQAGSTMVRLHDVSTGKDREVYRTAFEATCAWAARKAKIVCSIRGADSWAIDEISADSGKVKHLGSATGRAIVMDRFSRDDKSAYFIELQPGGYTISRWDVAAKQARVLMQDNVGGNYSYTTVSLDERWLVRTRLRSLEVRPISGGPWTRLATTSANETFVDATPDGNWVYYRDRDADGKPALFRVATSGGPSERMGNFPEGEAGIMRISPDGSRLVVETYNSSNGFETWSLDNFVPAEPKR